MDARLLKNLWQHSFVLEVTMLWLLTSLTIEDIMAACAMLKLRQSSLSDTWFIKKMGKIHTELFGTNFVSLHPSPDWMGLASMLCIREVDVRGEIQRDLSLDFQKTWQIFWILIFCYTCDPPRQRRYPKTSLLKSMNFLFFMLSIFKRYLQAAALSI